jgi:uncharacterized protein (PEP-CTERM system associated)
MPLKALFLLILVCVLASPAFADFEMTAGVGARLEYNDNIFLEEDAEDDVIAFLTPNIKLTWEIPHLTVSLNGGIQMKKYMDNTEEDDIGPILDSPTNLDILLNLYRDVFLLQVTDTYSQVVEKRTVQST